MNKRERLLIFGVLALVILGGGWFVVSNLVLGPLDARKAAVAQLEKDVQTRKDRKDQVLANLPKLERWKHQSLPAEVNFARLEYEKYLTELLRESDFAAGSSSVTAKPVDNKTSPAIPGKGPIYTKLAFTVQGRATLESLVKLLERFYRSGLLHQVRNLTIQRGLAPVTPGQQQQQPQRTRDLDITMTVEALVVAGGENRESLLPVERRLLSAEAALLGAAPRGPAAAAVALALADPRGPLGPSSLAQPPRDYRAVAANNIFLGPPLQLSEPRDDVEVTRFVRLIDITHGERRTEAFLYNRYTNQYYRLRTTAGFDTFRVLDGENEAAVKGKVVKIEDRDVIVQVDEKFYGIHMGQSLDEALRKALPGDRLKELGLTAAAKSEEDPPK
jgi:hypothetical protein